VERRGPWAPDSRVRARSVLAFASSFRFQVSLFPRLSSLSTPPSHTLHPTTCRSVVRFRALCEREGTSNDLLVACKHRARDRHERRWRPFVSSCAPRRAVARPPARAWLPRTPTRTRPVRQARRLGGWDRAPRLRSHSPGPEMR